MGNIRIFFAGDFCSKPSTAHISVSEDLKALLESCDLRVINFEAPLMPEPAQPHVLIYQNDDAPAFLSDLGFNLFPMANNHIFDCGEEGFLKTAAALGHRTFGSGRYEDAYKVKTVEIKGVKIGFMALCFAAKHGVFDQLEPHDGLACAYLNDLRVNHDIMAAKKEVDFLFVLPHDGIEYLDVPMPETIARYRDLIDYGADAVIGTHPHCPQGWETYKGKTIFYSLGNFFFNSQKSPDSKADKPHWYEGLCVIGHLCDGQLTFETVDTLNTANRRISIDKNEERQRHNEQLCHYLHDVPAYDRYLQEAVQKLAATQEFPIIERFDARLPLATRTQIFFKRILHRVTGRTSKSQQSLLTMLKNDTRRNLLFHALKNTRSK